MPDLWALPDALNKTPNSHATLLVLQEFGFDRLQARDENGQLLRQWSISDLLSRTLHKPTARGFIQGMRRFAGD